MSEEENSNNKMINQKIRNLYQDVPCNLPVGMSCESWQGKNKCLGTFPLVGNFSLLIENKKNKHNGNSKRMGDKGKYSVTIRSVKKDNGTRIFVPLETLDVKPSFRIISKSSRAVFKRTFEDLLAQSHVKLTDKQKVTLRGRLTSIQNRFDADRVAYGEECSDFLDQLKNEYERIEDHTYDKISLDEFKGAVKLYFPKFRVDLMVFLLAFSLQIKFKDLSTYAWPLTVGDAGSQKTTMYDIIFEKVPAKYALHVDMSTEAGIFSARDKKRFNSEDQEKQEVDVDSYNSLAILASGKNLINRDIFHFLSGRKDEAKRKMGLLQMLYDAQSAPAMSSFGSNVKQKKSLQPMVFLSSCTSVYYAGEFQEFKQVGERFMGLAYYFEDQLLRHYKRDDGTSLPLVGGVIENLTSEVRKKLRVLGKSVFLTLVESDIRLSTIPNNIKDLLKILFRVIGAAKSTLYHVSDFVPGESSIRGRSEIEFLMRLYSGMQGKSEVDLEDFRILRFIIFGAFPDPPIALVYALVQLLQLEMEKQDKAEFTVKDLRLFAKTYVGNLDYGRHVYYLSKFGILKETVQEVEDSDESYFPENGFKAHEKHVTKELLKVYKRSYKINKKYKLNEMFTDLYKEFKEIRRMQTGDEGFVFSDDIPEIENSENNNDDEFFEEVEE